MCCQEKESGGGEVQREVAAVWCSLGREWHPVCSMARGGMAGGVWASVSIGWNGWCVQVCRLLASGPRVGASGPWVGMSGPRVGIRGSLGAVSGLWVCVSDSWLWSSCPLVSQSCLRLLVSSLSLLVSHFFLWPGVRELWGIEAQGSSGSQGRCQIACFS